MPNIQNVLLHLRQYYLLCPITLDPTVSISTLYSMMCVCPVASSNAVIWWRLLSDLNTKSLPESKLSASLLYTRHIFLPQ